MDSASNVVRRAVSSSRMQMPDAAAFDFEPLREPDLPLVHEWLHRPHVAGWWQPTPSIDELRDDYLLPMDANRTRAYVAFLAARAVGLVQSYVVMHAGGGWWTDEDDPGARGIDQFLADETCLGKGVGSAMVRAFLMRLFADPHVTVVQTDPDPSNERAIRCYARMGFERSGTIVTPDGPAVLMRLRRPCGARTLGAQYVSHSETRCR